MACTGCVKAAQAKGRAPKCENCDWNPPLLPENEDAWELWCAVATQWRVGMGIVGLDYAEVRRWAEELGIGLTPSVWGKLRALEREVLSRQGGSDAGDRAGHRQARPGPPG